MRETGTISSVIDSCRSEAARNESAQVGGRTLRPLMVSVNEKLMTSGKELFCDRRRRPSEPRMTTRMVSGRRSYEAGTKARSSRNADSNSSNIRLSRGGWTTSQRSPPITENVSNHGHIVSIDQNSNWRACVRRHVSKQQVAAWVSGG